MRIECTAAATRYDRSTRDEWRYDGCCSTEDTKRWRSSGCCATTAKYATILLYYYRYFLKSSSPPPGDLGGILRMIYVTQKMWMEVRRAGNPVTVPRY